METGKHIEVITIGDENFEIDFERIAAIGPDLDEEMDTVSSQIAFYGKLLARSQEERVILDSLYRNWKAKIANEVLKKDEKTAEWKVRSIVEANDKFLTFKKAESACQRNETVLETLIKALLEKSPNLRSKGARLREELKSVDMTTRTQVSQRPQVSPEEAREILQSRKPKNERTE